MNIDKIIGSGLTSLASREKLIDELKRLGIKNSEVMNLISHMPRHLFIDTALANRAYENVSLPIGFKQTISQPYMVARMTELIHETDSMDNVLCQVRWRKGQGNAGARACVRTRASE